MPSLLAAETAYRKSIMWHGLTLVTVALAGYHAEHGKYPLKLPVLAPEFLPKVPRDLFIDKPLHYKNTAGGGVLLYSVGENMHDDGGHMQTMFSSSGSGPLIIPENAPDDLAVRLGK